MNGVDVEELIILRLAGNEIEGAAGGGGGDDDDDEGAGSGKSLASLKKEVDKYIGIVKEKDDQEKRANVIAIQATQVEQYTCKNCKNSDPTLFAEDSKHGEIVCMKCGVVAVQSKIFQGDYERVFEDDDTVKSHGSVPDPKFSSATNLQTTIQVQSRDFAQKGGDNKSGARILMLLQKQVDQLSETNNEEKRTRESYKDDQKRKVFDVIQDTGESLFLHKSCIERAKFLFTSYRDKMEKVQRLPIVVAACMIAAYREMLDNPRTSNLLKNTGLKRFRDNDADENDKDTLYAQLHPFQCDWCKKRFNSKTGLKDHKYDCAKKPT